MYFYLYIFFNVILQAELTWCCIFFFSCWSHECLTMTLFLLSRIVATNKILIFSSVSLGYLFSRRSCPVLHCAASRSTNHTGAGGDNKQVPKNVNHGFVFVGNFFLFFFSQKVPHSGNVCAGESISFRAPQSHASLSEVSGTRCRLKLRATLAAVSFGVGSKRAVAVDTVAVRCCERLTRSLVSPGPHTVNSCIPLISRDSGCAMKVLLQRRHTETVLGLATNLATAFHCFLHTLHW